MSTLWFGVAFSAIRMLIGGVSAIYLLRNGMTIEDIGYLKAFQALVILTLDIPISYTVDKYSKAVAVRIAVLCSALWLLLTGLGSTFLVFLFAELFNALSLVFFGGAFVAMLLNGVPNSQKLMVLSRYQKWQHLAMSFAALIGPVLALDVANSAIWFVAAFLMTVLFLISMFLLAHLKGDTESSHSSKSFKTALVEDGKAISVIFISARYAALFIFLVGLIYQVVIQYWQPYLGYVGNLSNEGYVWGITFFAILLIQSIAAFFVQHLNRLTALVFLLASLLIVCFSGAWASPSITQILLVLSVFFVLRVLAIFGGSWFHTRIPDKYRATSDAVKKTFSGVSLVFLLPFVGGLLQEYVTNSTP